MSNVLPFPLLAANLPKRRVVLHRSGPRFAVDVVEETSHGQTLYFIHQRNIWTDATTIIGGFHSLAEARSMALEAAR